MIEILTKDDVEELNSEKNDQYYIPGELFNGMQYNLIRLEVKWAYVAVLNTLLNKPHYDQDNNAYVKDDSPAIIEMLVKIANKKVNAAKIEGYLDEMDELELVRRDGRNVYVRKIVSIFQRKVPFSFLIIRGNIYVSVINKDICT